MPQFGTAELASGAFVCKWTCKEHLAKRGSTGPRGVDDRIMCLLCLQVLVPVPDYTAKCTILVTTGKAKYDATKKAIVSCRAWTCIQCHVPCNIVSAACQHLCRSAAAASSPCQQPTQGPLTSTLQEGVLLVDSAVLRVSSVTWHADCVLCRCGRSSGSQVLLSTACAQR